MERRQKILNIVKNSEGVTGAELAAELGVSRQAINRHLQNLVQEGRVIKTGETRGARFYPPGAAKGKRPVKRRFAREYDITRIEEDAVYADVAALLNLKTNLTNNAEGVANYAFTEMLNNAIDHAESQTCRVEVVLDSYLFKFWIRDYGIGLFHSIASKHQLPNEEQVVGELLKGKTTTMPERHTGEGIFFTSKAGDTVSYRSHRTQLVFDNSSGNTYVEEKRYIKGTEVFFQLRRKSKTDLSRIFQTYAGADFDYKFEKTAVTVQVLRQNCISRSEARRLLNNLEKFSLIVLDFAGIKNLGQAFADEIFRVFLKNNPEISIEAKNLRPTLQQMVYHVVDNQTFQQLTIR